MRWSKYTNESLPKRNLGVTQCGQTWEYQQSQTLLASWSWRLDYLKPVKCHYHFKLVKWKQKRKLREKLCATNCSRKGKAGRVTKRWKRAQNSWRRKSRRVVENEMQLRVRNKALWPKPSVLVETYCNSSDITAKRHITPPPENFGNATSLLGVSIRQNHSKRVKYLTQNIYIEGILDNSRMINSKAVSPPPAPGAQAEEFNISLTAIHFTRHLGACCILSTAQDQKYTQEWE